MRKALFGTVVLAVIMIVSALPASAQAPVRAADHIVPAAALSSTVLAQTKVDQQNRDAVIRALDRTEVQDLARQMGLDVTKAKAVVAQMSSAELARAAAPAADVNRDLSGGTTTIVVSVTTLLLILILIVLIVK